MNDDKSSKVSYCSLQNPYYICIEIYCALLIFAAENEPQKAVAILRGEPGNEQVSGVVRFTQLSASNICDVSFLIITDRIKIEADIKGLKKGQHGFHIHQWGDLTNVLNNFCVELTYFRDVPLQVLTTILSKRTTVHLMTKKDTLEILETSMLQRMEKAPNSFSKIL